MATYAVTLKGPCTRLPSKDHIQLSWTDFVHSYPKPHNENSVCFPTQLEHSTAPNQLNVGQMNTAHTRQSLNQLNVGQMNTPHTRQSRNQLNVSQMNTKAIKVPACHLSFAPCTVRRRWPSCSTVSESTPSRTASQRAPAFSSSTW